MRYVLTTLMIVASLIVSACSTRSPNSNFYLLENTVATPSPTGELRVGLGPVTVADYLQKPQIAIRTDTSQIAFSEFERWASDLRGLIIGSLQHDLAIELNTSNVFEFPWRKLDNIDIAVQLDIKRFDASFIESLAFIEANLVLTGKDGESMARSYSLSEPVEGRSYAAVVAAERRLLKRLAHNIAEIAKQP